MYDVAVALLASKENVGIFTTVGLIILTMAKTVSDESFIEVRKEERCLWDVNSVIYKTRYKKVKNRKKNEQNSLAS